MKKKMMRGDKYEKEYPCLVVPGFCGDASGLFCQYKPSGDSGVRNTVILGGLLGRHGHS